MERNEIGAHETTERGQRVQNQQEIHQTDDDSRGRQKRPHDAERSPAEQNPGTVEKPATQKRNRSPSQSPVRQRRPNVPVRRSSPVAEGRGERRTSNPSGENGPLFMTYVHEAVSWAQKADPQNLTITKAPFPNSTEEIYRLLRNDGLRNAIKSHLQRYTEAYVAVKPKLTGAGKVKSINDGLQPFIAVVYGPTGSGKSQFLRNVISSALIQPAAETVFLITPDEGMLPNEEIAAWRAQCVEGLYAVEKKSLNRLVPQFILLTYEKATSDENLSIDNPNNVFAKAASKGSVCIIMDECMNKLSCGKAVSAFFHALPSKIYGRYPKCVGYTLLVVLHNMCPRQDRGNVKDLRIQSKCHIISPQLDPGQIGRFIKTYSFGLPKSMIPVLLDIIDSIRQKSKYSWIIYNNCPSVEALRWLYYTPEEQLNPIYVNLQMLYFQTCKELRNLASLRHSHKLYNSKIKKQ
ncbi:IVa2 [Barthadenovirus mellis]|uniref:IVa2 n=1 Tax=Passerine adenovirus 1 TaxID=2779174 RepID=A0A7L9DIP3_9ADEN|nr:IVa2 [Passerine adenovirus 1]